jgi:hypothetical protein
MNFLSPFLQRAVAPSAVLALLVALAPSSAWAQTTENTNVGATQKLTMTVTNTHGINTSASMTPDFDVVSYAKLVIKPDGSSSFQSAGDGAAAALNIGGGTSEAITRGMSGGAVIEFDQGTEAYSLIIPTGYVLDTVSGQYVAPREACEVGTDGCAADGTKAATFGERNFNAVANGSAAVTSQTQLTIEQTLNEFENTLTSTLE